MRSNAILYGFGFVCALFQVSLVCYIHKINRNKLNKIFWGVVGRGGFRGKKVEKNFLLPISSSNKNFRSTAAFCLISDDVVSIRRINVVVVVVVKGGGRVNSTSRQRTPFLYYLVVIN